MSKLDKENKIRNAEVRIDTYMQKKEGFNCLERTKSPFALAPINFDPYSSLLAGAPILDSFEIHPSKFLFESASSQEPQTKITQSKTAKENIESICTLELRKYQKKKHKTLTDFYIRIINAINRNDVWTDIYKYTSFFYAYDSVTKTRNRKKLFGSEWIYGEVQKFWTTKVKA